MYNQIHFCGQPNSFLWICWTYDETSGKQIHICWLVIDVTSFRIPIRSNVNIASCGCTLVGCNVSRKKHEVAFEECVWCFMENIGPIQFYIYLNHQMFNLHYQMQIKDLQISRTETICAKWLQTTNLHPQIQEKKITMLITAP